MIIEASKERIVFSNLSDNVVDHNRKIALDWLIPLQEESELFGSFFYRFGSNQIYETIIRRFLNVALYNSQKLIIKKKSQAATNKLILTNFLVTVC